MRKRWMTSDGVSPSSNISAGRSHVAKNIATLTAISAFSADDIGPGPNENELAYGEDWRRMKKSGCYHTPPTQKDKQQRAVGDGGDRRGEREDGESQRANERDAQHHVQDDGRHADEDRRPALPQRVKHRRHDARGRVADEPEGVIAQRRGG